VQWVPGLFPQDKSARAMLPPPPSSNKVKEGVQLYLYLPYRPSWPDIRRNLPFTFLTLPLDGTVW
jgi:hypothetical protein